MLKNSKLLLSLFAILLLALPLSGCGDSEETVNAKRVEEVKKELEKINAEALAPDMVMTCGEIIAKDAGTSITYKDCELKSLGTTPTAVSLKLPLIETKESKEKKVESVKYSNVSLSIKNTEMDYDLNGTIAGMAEEGLQYDEKDIMLMYSALPKLLKVQDMDAAMQLFEGLSDSYKVKKGSADKMLFTVKTQGQLIEVKADNYAIQDYSMYASGPSSMNGVGVSLGGKPLFTLESMTCAKQLTPKFWLKLKDIKSFDEFRQKLTTDPLVVENFAGKNMIVEFEGQKLVVSAFKVDMNLAKDWNIGMDVVDMQVPVDWLTSADPTLTKVLAEYGKPIVFSSGLNFVLGAKEGNNTPVKLNSLNIWEKNLGGFDLKGELELDEAALAAAGGDEMSSASAVRIKNAVLTIKDTGLSILGFKAATQDSGMSEAQLRQQATAGVMMGAAMLPPSMQSLGTAASAFVEKQGTLEITLKPQAPVSIADVMANPEALGASAVHK